MIKILRTQSHSTKNVLPLVPHISPVWVAGEISRARRVFQNSVAGSSIHGVNTLFFRKSIFFF